MSTRSPNRLPKAIRTDNGVPFASPNALFVLSRLSVWWLLLGIEIERIKPGHPGQNGRHERLHLTLKRGPTRPVAYNLLQQHGRFEDCLAVYNNERPHQALNMRYPAELYTPSTREYRIPDEPAYPSHYRTIRVTRRGRICIGHRKINFSTVFAGQSVGIREDADKLWLVSFMNYDSGFFIRTKAGSSPAPIVLDWNVNYVSGTICKPCLRYRPRISGLPRRREAVTISSLIRLTSLRKTRRHAGRPGPADRSKARQFSRSRIFWQTATSSPLHREHCATPA